MKELEKLEDREGDTKFHGKKSAELIWYIRESGWMICKMDIM